jgi:hypothetical protein
MRALSVLSILFVVSILPACGGKDANTEICLRELKEFEKLHAAQDEKAREVAGGVYQSCGISCDIVKDADACKAFKRVTEVICEKEGQETCKRLCEGSNNKKNETACALVK